MNAKPHPGILIHAFDYPPLDGGVARLCGVLAEALAKAGIEVRVLSTHHRGRGMAVPTVPVARVTLARGYREAHALLTLRSSFVGAVTLCGSWYPEGLLATLAQRPSRVILAHGGELFPPCSIWRSRLWPSLLRHVLTSADLVVANSYYTAALVRSAAPRAAVATIPLAVDLARFHPGDRSASRRQLGIPEHVRVILTVSRLQAYKGHDLVLAALASLPPSVRANLLWLVAGRGEEAARLREMASQLGVASNVRWLGFVPDAELVPLYQCADLFVLCTRQSPINRHVEGFGLVFLEAQACGVSVVGTRTGGIPEALEEGRGGFLIDQDDCRALSLLLERLVAEPEHFYGAGKLARMRVQSECTWTKYIDRLLFALGQVGLAVRNAPVTPGSAPAQ